jgi:RNA polymerase sigma-70 factor (ECF subfamily)
MRELVNTRGTVPSAAEVMVEQTDNELVARAKAGDRRAFERLVAKYQRRAFAVAMGYLKNPEDAMDAAQDAFVKVFRNIQGFKGDSSFYTWLYRIVVNVCIDHIRKHRKARNVEYDETFRRRDEAHVDPLSGNTRPMHPGAAAESKQLHGVLAEALEQLSENHRTIIVLREVEGLSYEEIAEIMECHLGTVMSRLHHARKNLQTALKPYLDATGNPMGDRAGVGVRGKRKKRSEA